MEPSEQWSKLPNPRFNFNFVHINYIKFSIKINLFYIITLHQGEEEKKRRREGGTILLKETQVLAKMKQDVVEERRRAIR